MRNFGEHEPMELQDGFWPDENPGDFLTKPLQEVLKRRSDLYFNWMIRRDMPYVLALEKGQPVQSWDEWTEEDYIKHLRQRNEIAMVVRDSNDPDKVFGCIVYRLKKDSLEILHIVLRPGDDQEDVLLLMLAKMVAKGGPRKYLQICVDVGDLKTIAALQKADFSFPQKAEGNSLLCGRLIVKGLGSSS